VSSWKGPELERAAKVHLLERFRVNFGTRLGLENAKFRFKRKLPLIKPQDLKRSLPLNQQLKEAFPQRCFLKNKC